MRELLKTLFILTKEAYLALDNENVVVKKMTANWAKFRC